MMKALIVMPRYNMYLKDNRSYYISHGMMYIASWLKSRGMDIDTLNLNHYPPERFARTLESGKYSAVLTGGLFSKYDSIKYIVDETRKYNPEIKTIVGGAIASAHPEFAFQSLQPDYLVIGEGERTAEKLLETIWSAGDPGQVAGIGFHKNGRFIQTEKVKPIEDIDTLPYPDYEGFEFGRFLDGHPLNVHAYFQGNDNIRFGIVYGGRDCPSKCTFCFRTLGGRLRLRQVDNVIAEMKFLMKQYGVDGFMILDDVFALTKKRIYKFCRMVKPLKVQWLVQMRVDMVDEALLKAMKDAGCFMINYGIESGSQTILDSMKKGTTVQANERALALTRKVGIGIRGNIIFGDPAETAETLDETINFYHRHINYGLSAVSIRAFPGTALYFDLLKKGRLDGLVDFWQNNASLPDGTIPNLTRLPENEYRRLQARFEKNVSLKNLVRVLDVKPLQHQKDEFYIKMECPICRKRSGGLAKLWFDYWAVCPHCRQRSWLPIKGNRNVLL